MKTFGEVVRDLKWMLYVAAVVALVLSLLVGVAFVLNFTLDETESAKDLVEIIQLFVVASAIVIGGFFTLHKLQIFRDFEPHLTVSQEVSHRFVGDKYIHVETTATLHNSSRVKIEVREGLFRLQRIAPTSDEEIRELNSKVFVDQEYKHLHRDSPYWESSGSKGNLNEMVAS